MKGCGEAVKAGAYLLLNIISGTGIVFANKAVFSLYKFRFIYALTLTHAVATALGMSLFCALRLFELKRLPVLEVLPLAGAYVGYIVFWNLSLQINPVGFYQLSKIMVTPAVVCLELLVSSKFPTKIEQAAIATLCIGVSLATVTDPSVSANLLGLAIGIAAVGFTAIYQVWAGSKQKELQASSMQLMHQYSPLAAMLLVVLVPLLEPLGLHQEIPGPDTLLGYPYTLEAVSLIASTAVLGLLVSISTFLVIGATSPVTFNVTGHLKTVIVIAGGVSFFGEGMPPKRFVGVVLALIGILWYSCCKLTAAKQLAQSTESPEHERLLKAKASSPVTPPQSEERGLHVQVKAG